MDFTERQKQNFISKIEKDDNGCWNWTGCCINSGYGRVNINKKTMLAHRASYMMFIGEIDELQKGGYHGTCVMHSCDNKKCVNPNHLSLGTQLDNVLDRVKKGRSAIVSGIHNPNWKGGKGNCVSCGNEHKHRYSHRNKESRCRACWKINTTQI